MHSDEMLTALFGRICATPCRFRLVLRGNGRAEAEASRKSAQ